MRGQEGELWELEREVKFCGNSAVANASEDENVYYEEWTEKMSTAWVVKSSIIAYWACSCKEDSGSLERLYM